MLHIPYIGFHTSFHVFQLTGFATETGHLRPSRDTGFDEMADHVFIDYFGIFFRVFQHVRAWSHNGHISQQYIDELRKFVNIGPAHEIAEFGFSRIIEGGL